MISIDQLYNVPSWLSSAGPDADVIVSTRIRLARNLAEHPFPFRSSLQERARVFEKVTDACAKLPLCRGFAVSNFTKISPTGRYFLVEERVASPDLANIDGERGVISDAGRRINIMVNEEDHLRLTCMDSGSCAQGMWETVDALDTALGNKVAYAWDHRRGFLTACPTNSGTGLRVSFLVHLPGLVLTKTIDQVLQAASQMGVSTRGFFGEHSAVVGNLFQLSNQATMGASEIEFIEATQSLIRRVVSLEREARARVLRDAKPELADKVMRAYGILRYARTLSVEEYLTLSSALRFGIEAAVLSGLTVQDLNRFMLLVLPAHLETLYDRTMKEDELGMVRADMVRQLLKDKTGEI